MSSNNDARRRFIAIAGDATQEATYRSLLGDARVDALITDPPYCLLTRRRKGGDLRETKHRKIDRDPVVRFEDVRTYRTFTEQWLGHASRSLKPGAPAVIWTNFLGKQPILDVAKSCGLKHLWGEFTWAKRTKETQGSEVLLRVYEIALVLSATPAPPIAVDGKPIPWSVVAGYDDEQEAETWGLHPHHKPFGVLEPLIRQYSNVGDLILDPFAGSGSIPATALKLLRRTACIEREEDWAERVTQRLEQTQPLDSIAGAHES